MVLDVAMALSLCPRTTEVVPNLGWLTDSTTGLIKGDTADIKGSLNTLNTNVQAGFVSLTGGIAVVIDQQKASNNLLDINRQQNDTMICWLANIADVLCRMLHRLNRQVGLQTAMENSLR